MEPSTTNTSPYFRQRALSLNILSTGTPFPKRPIGPVRYAGCIRCISPDAGKFGLTQPTAGGMLNQALSGLFVDMTAVSGPLHHAGGWLEVFGVE